MTVCLFRVFGMWVVGLCKGRRVMRFLGLRFRGFMCRKEFFEWGGCEE